jgi:hypothetical protein
MVMDDNVKNFLDKIQEIKDTKIKVDIISTGKQADSSPLSFKQQKDIISTIADGAIGSLKFQKILNRVVVENTGDSLLRTIDRLPIILKLRAESIGAEAKIGDDKVKIQKILDKVTKKPKIKQSDKLLGDIQVTLEVPLITYENLVIQATIDAVKKDGDEVGKNIGSIYTYEIVKYIKNIEFGGEIVDFYEIPIQDRVNIVDSLPISTNQKIIEFIQNIKKIENDWLTVEIDGEKKVLEIDVSFFDG